MGELTAEWCREQSDGKSKFAAQLRASAPYSPGVAEAAADIDHLATALTIAARVLDEGAVEGLARVVFAKANPGENWDLFDERFEARGNRLHPMQESATSTARAILAYLKGEVE